MSNEEKIPPPSREPHYSVSVAEAVILFAEAGVPRSPRSIRRYCEKGHLNATKADGLEGDQYLIDPESIERRIEELHQQELVSRHSRTRPDKTGTSRTRPDDTQTSDLGLKLRDAEITNRAKDMYIEKLEEQNDRLIETISTKSYEIGRLETEVRQLGAPSDERHKEIEEASVIEEQPPSPDAIS